MSLRENSQNFRGNPDKKVDCFVAKIVNAPRNDGFTLAEVLITLVIIGVIAAITVPSLINKTQNQEYVSKLKKAYSTLSQATNLIISEEGLPKNWATTVDNSYNLYKKHLINAKECGSGTGCYNQGNYRWLNGNIRDYNWNERTEYRKLVLSDDTQVLFDSPITNMCNMQNYWSIGSNDMCEIIFVDINGARKPNQFGKDLFLFVLKGNGLHPAGCDIEGYCNGPSSNQGKGCACKVLREGAINY